MGDNIGPSLYAKAQGKPVEIWGFFGHGKLHYYVLPRDGDKTTNMNGQRYEWVINQYFAKWRRSCFEADLPVHLVQDHERCLWQEQNLKALRKAGRMLMEDFPKSSPDLNAIEGWWRILRERLEATAPEAIEGRADFVSRLRRTVAWLNDNKWEDGLVLCTNQKVRAREVQKLKGAKTKW